MKDPWIKWFPGDFLHGVSELEAGEGWVYTIVLNLIHDGGGPWTLNLARLARRCRMRPTATQKALDTLLDLGKLTLIDGALTNARAVKSLESRQKVSENSTEAANARWENERAKAKENNAPDHADAMHNGCDRNAILEARSQIELEANASLSPRATKAKPKGRVYPEAFEAAWRTYPHHKGRSSKPNAAAQWARLPEDERAGLVAAIARFAPNVAETCGGKGAPDMAVWLKDGKHLNWQADIGIPTSEPVAAFNAPQVRASIVKATDEDFARRWVDHYCRWEPEARRLEARTPAVAAALSKSLTSWAERNSVTIAVASANDGAALKQTGEAA
jgi:hypothetical protein